MLAFLSFLFLTKVVNACTAITVEKTGTVDGSTLNAHTNDCRQCDFRLAYIPATHNNPKGSRRGVYPLRPEYPRYVGEEMGPVYSIKNLDTSIFNWTEMKPVGHIDQVADTYAYLDNSFPIMNERQVAMGESTCSAKLYALPKFAGGRALFDMTALTRIALERCASARCAIRTIGALAEQYGFYGEDWSGNKALEYAEAGEGMAISDAEESWVMNIMPDDSGASAVWAAQRVPVGHIAPIVNEFTIKELDLSQPDWYMASDNVHEVAIRNGFWNPKNGPFNFMRAYTYDDDKKHYSQRRQWRILSLAAPSLNLDPNTSMFDLPFSVPVERKLTPQDVFIMLRDHFEGTPYDQTVGPSAGPYGDPNRYDRGAGSGANPNVTILGQFERSISIFRASFSYVTQSRGWLPNAVGGKVWFGHYAPHATVYVPFYISGHVPKSYSSGSLQKFDKSVSFWAFLTVGNWADKMYKYIMEDVRNKANTFEEAAFDGTENLESDVLQIYDRNDLSEAEKNHRVRHRLNKWCNKFADDVIEEWWQFFEFLITKWHDNYRMDGLHDEIIKPTAMFYPQWWLEMVGYYSPEVLAQLKANASAAFDYHAIAYGLDVSGHNFATTFFLVCMLAMFFFTAGIYVGQKRARNHEYIPIS